MARKSKTIADDMPRSPLAGKLIGEVLAPVPVAESEKTAVAVGEGRSAPVEAEKRATRSAPANEKGGRAKKTGGKKRAKSTSRLAKTYEARVMLAHDERDSGGQVVTALRRGSGTQVTFSHLVRALCSLAVRALPAIKANGGELDLPPRPPNNDWRALAEYEDAIADFLLVALRDKNRMDGDAE